VTLADLIPSLRGSLPRPLDAAAWPADTHHLPGGDLRVAGFSLMALARRCGTPTAVLDEGGAVVTVHRVLQVRRDEGGVLVYVNALPCTRLAETALGRDAGFAGAHLLSRLAAAPDAGATVIGVQGDGTSVLVERAVLPSDIRAGDLLAVSTKPRPQSRKPPSR
jgi:hypothetical protein